MIQLNVKPEENVTLNVSEEKNVNLKAEEVRTVGVPGGGTNDHNKLINRELPDQHPMFSITGLQEALSNIELTPGPEGPAGPPGRDGSDGKDGVDGQPGYSPIRGVDYWTDKDKQEIIAEVPGADLTGYATEEYVSKKIAEAQIGGEGGDIDLSAYYTKIETDNAIKTAVDAIEIPEVSDGKDGKDGKDGVDGKDGISATHSWDGTILTITSASGTSSADLKGKDGTDGKDGVDGYTPQKGIDYFDGKDGVDGKDGENGKDGYTPQKDVDYFDGKDGKDGQDGYTPQKNVDYFDGKNGQDGKDGYSPVRGTDYWTAADKQEILSETASMYPVVHTGTSAPASSLGKNGDLYLRVY